jgi:hypothetical protein
VSIPVEVIHDWKAVPRYTKGERRRKREIDINDKGGEIASKQVEKSEV